MFLLRLICLLAGTVLGVLYILLLLRDGKYAEMTQDLENFENKELCGAGFVLQEVPVFALRGKLGKRLRREAELLRGHKYGEYYARLYYARALSMTMLVAAVTLLLGSLLSGRTGVLVLLGGVIATACIWMSQSEEMKKELDQRRESCRYEFPNVISKLALLVSSGMVLYEAWGTVAKSRNGVIYDLMKQACEDVDNGMSEADAYYRFGILSDCQDVRKFSSMMVQSMEKGGSDLTMFLMQQSKALWSEKRQMALQAGDAAAAKLLVPTVLMLVGILLIILSAAFMGVLNGF